MSNGKKIFVTTATGDQGSSVAKYLLKDGFEVYGLTRNTDSPKAKEIEKLGAKLVKGDLADVSSYSHALEGMDGIFINADFWAPFFASGFNVEHAVKTEQEHAKGAVDAAVKAKIPHLVYSTLGDVQGNIYPGHHYPHHDSKAEISQYIRKINAPGTHLFTSHYISNCVKFPGILTEKPDGSWHLSYPCPDDTPLPQYAVEQTGAWVSIAFKNPKEWIGKDMDACSDASTYAEVAAAIAQVTGKKVTTNHIDEATMDSEELKKQVGDEMWCQYKQFQLKHMPRDIETSKKLVPDQWDVKAWVEQSPELEALMKWRK